MAVRIRLKRLGRKHRPFFRVCAMDARSPRDGKVIEELGYYDPMVRETDARAVLNAERIDYWLGVGAQPTEKVRVLIQKYGSNGTHLEAQRQARERVQSFKHAAPPPMKFVPKKKAEAAEQAEGQGEAGQGEAGQGGEAEQPEPAGE